VQNKLQIIRVCTFMTSRPESDGHHLKYITLKEQKCVLPHNYHKTLYPHMVPTNLTWRP